VIGEGPRWSDDCAPDIVISTNDDSKEGDTRFPIEVDIIVILLVDFGIDGVFFTSSKEG
jgi:hypothetical protein